MTITTLSLALAEGSFNPLHFDPSAVVLTSITFGVLFVLLSKFAWGPILGAVEAREKRIDDAIQQAEDDRASAEKTLTEYNQRVSNVESEMAALREKGRTEAEAMRREILDKAQAESKAVAASAQRDIESAKSQAIQELRAEAVDIGMAIAGKVVGRSVDSDDHRRLADQVISEVSGAGNGGATRNN